MNHSFNYCKRNLVLQVYCNFHILDDPWNNDRFASLKPLAITTEPQQDVTVSNSPVNVGSNLTANLHKLDLTSGSSSIGGVSHSTEKEMSQDLFQYYRPNLQLLFLL